MSLKNHRPRKYEVGISPFVLLFSLTLVIGCTKQEFVNMPDGDVVGTILFDDFNRGYYDYPGGSFQIKAQCCIDTFWASPDENGKFSFSNLPMGGAKFTIYENDRELVCINNCSFLGGGEPSELNFYFKIQPDIKSIVYHFEIINNILWLLGHVELDEIPSMKSDKIMIFMSYPPQNHYTGIAIPFDWDTGEIRYSFGGIGGSDSGTQINSYVYKKYRRYYVGFKNYVVSYEYYGSLNDELGNSHIVKSDSTTLYSYIIP